MMNPKWFTNRGQAVQVTCAVIATILTGISAWPNVQQLQFLGIAPVAFYAAVAFSFVTVLFWKHPSAAKAAEPSPATVEPTPPPQKLTEARLWPPANLPTGLAPNSLAAVATFEKFVCSVGSYIEVKAAIGTIKVTLANLKRRETKEILGSGKTANDVADLHVTTGGGIVYSGFVVIPVSTNRFLVPVASHLHTAEPVSLFTFSFSEKHFSFVGIRVDHINTHAKEATIAICQTRGLRPEF